MSTFKVDNLITWDGVKSVAVAAIADAVAATSAKFDKTGGDISGNVNIVGTGRRITADFSNASVANRAAFQTSTVNGNTFVHFRPNGTAVASGVISTTGSDGENYNSIEIVVTPAASIVRAGQSGTGVIAPLELNSGAVKCLRLDPTTFAFTSVNGALGYGTGAGGAVTQPTSKSTGVTLNKPCGMITTHEEYLAAGAAITFVLNNSVIASTDVVVATISYQGGAGVNYRVSAVTGLIGQCVISIQNISGAARAEAIEIHFAVIKKANA